MELFKSSLRGFVGLSVICITMAGKLEAQNLARVEKIQRTVEKQAGQSPKWVNAGTGTTLVSGERLRTGKRSKSDLRFSDKSLLRLGQLSSLELSGDREVRLLQGQLLLSALSPARILAGSATAAIKGTVPLIKVLPNGDAEFSLYTGEVELTTPKGTLTLKPGQWVRVAADGDFSKVKSVAPFFFMNGDASFDLLIAPRNQPFVGSNEEIKLREEPNRQLFESAVAALSPEATSTIYNPFDQTRGGGGTGGTGGGGSTGGRIANTDSEGTATLASVSATAATLSASTGEEHLGEVNPNIGSIGAFDAQLFGAIATGDGDGSLYAGRLGASGALGKAFFDVAVTPLRERQFGDTRETALVTQALMTYRTGDFDIKAGRQRIWDGPVHASLWGSMLRQGGRNTFDAVRISSRPNKSLTFDAAYLVDAYPRLLTQDASGRQRGYYGRAELREEKFALGVNALRFIKAPNPSQTGITVDFVLPVASDFVEVYGEVGRDSFKRKTNTFGVNFPSLYQKTGIDLFLETAKTKSTNSFAAPERELAARLYRKVGNNLNLMVAANKFEGDDVRVVLGLTVGAHATARNDAFEEFVSRP